MLKILLESFNVLLLEWYDFAIFSYFSEHINTYLDSSDDYLAQKIYFFSFLSRPLGALFFGYIFDKWNKKTALKAIVIMLIFSSAMISCTPSIVGISTVWFTLARLLQCFALAGGYGSSFIYVYSNLKDNGNRHFIMSIISSSFLYGILLGEFVFLTLKLCLPQNIFLQYGWRIAFSLATVIGIIWLQTEKKEKLEDNTVQTFDTTKKTWNLQIFVLTVPVLLLDVGGYHLLISILDLNLYIPLYIRFIQKIIIIILVALLGKIMDYYQEIYPTISFNKIMITIASILFVISKYLSLFTIIQLTPMMLSFVYVSLASYITQQCLEYVNPAQLLGILINGAAAVMGFLLTDLRPNDVPSTLLFIGIGSLLSVWFSYFINTKK